MFRVDGSSYNGTFKDGKQDGKGIEVEKSGFKYIGGFKDGNRHGFGYMMDQKGQVRNGEWNNGLRVRWIGEVFHPKEN